MFDATAEQHDAWAGDGGVGDEGVTQGGWYAGKRRHTLVDSGHVHRQHRRSVEEGVPHSGRRVGQVADDAPRPVSELHDVGGVRRQPSSRWRQADRPDPIPLRRAQCLAGDHAVGDESARPVEVREDPLHRGGALDDARRQTLERRPIENEWHRVDAPRPAVHVHLVNEVSGTRRGEHTIGFRLPADQRRSIARQPVEDVFDRHATLRRR